MGLFGRLFNTKRVASAVLIDIAADSVAGAYATYPSGELPVVLYAQRIPIEIGKGELHQKALVRALQTLGEVLIREGAPLLARATGNGASDTILVSIEAPWQKTTVRTEFFAQKEPFIFSKHLVTAALKKTSAAPPGQLLVDESIIGTVLNGYETRDPYGKKVTRASIVILTSFLDEEIGESIFATLRSLYHTKHIVSIAGTSLRYQAMRDTFPHESDAFILDVSGPLTSLSLIRRGLLVDVVEAANPLSDTAQWLQNVMKEFAGIAARFPLPRTIFLVARESDLVPLRKALDGAQFDTLWLSDNPPKIVSVLGSHIAGLVRNDAAAPPDVPLLFMAFFHQHHPREESV